MVYTVRCYKNTGFGPNDRPSNPAILDTAQYTDFPSNWLLQGRDRVSIRIQTTYGAIKDVDYVRLSTDGETVYYIVATLTMLNENTAELVLSVDPIATAGGISQFSIIDGWTRRAHSATDNLFENTIPENWTPQGRLENDALTYYGDTPTADGQDSYNIVTSTVELDSAEQTAKTYVDSATGGGTVTVPEIPKAAYPAKIGVAVDDALTRFFSNPLQAFFNADDELVKEGLQAVRSLGIESAITGAYTVPAYYVAGALEHRVFDPDTEEWHTVGWTRISGNRYNIRPALAYEYATVKNKKVFALYNIYQVLSVCSGDKDAYEAKDLYHATIAPDAPLFALGADPGPNGSSYMQPQVFDGRITMLQEMAVRGASWLALPIAFYGGSGAAMNDIAAMNGGADRGVDHKLAYIQSGLNVAGSAISGAAQGASMGGVWGAVGGAIGGAIKGAVNEGMNVAREHIDYNRDMRDIAIEQGTKNNIVAPDLRFPVNPGLQGYTGNGFCITRTRLSPADVERLDRYFTQFGYAQDKPFEKSDLTNRTYFNFIQTIGATIGGGGPLRLRAQIAELFNSGVRLWHVLPNSGAMQNNPIRA